MTYLAGSELRGSSAIARAQAVERRVARAVVIAQTFLVVRILSLLILVSFLPNQLPSFTLGLDRSHILVVPLNGLTGGTALLIIAGVSAVELYMVYRLAERSALARFTVLVIESLAILSTASALALGAELAALPLLAAVGATGMLLLNQVRWAFRLQRQRVLTGRRQGGVFAGYAGAPLETTKPPQEVGYSIPPQSRR
jgi:hypothetical protein